MIVPSENKGDKLIYIGWDMAFLMLAGIHTFIRINDEARPGS
jgi:hypothetical protein